MYVYISNVKRKKKTATTTKQNKTKKQKQRNKIPTHLYNFMNGQSNIPPNYVIFPPSDCTSSPDVITSPGIISSSNYPYNYYNNENCFTYIKAGRGKQIILTFSDFDIENSVYACYDTLR